MDPLSVTNLDAYYGKAHVLHGVSLSAAAGAVTGVLGRNGAGKTTLLRSIMRLEPRVEGSVNILGRDTKGLAADGIARLGVAYMPQDVRVFPRLSVRENIQVAAASVVQPMPLLDILAVLPELEPLLKQAAGTLSGGQQQLVGIGRSLSMRCRVLLMDEPTEGLMPLLVSRVGEIMRGLASRGVAVLLIEQNIHLALTVCDTIYVVEKGEIRWQGAAAALADGTLLDRYLGVNVLETASAAGHH